MITIKILSNVKFRNLFRVPAFLFLIISCFILSILIYKTKLKINKLHYYISEQRKSCLNELSSYLVSNFKTIVIENLNVVGMLKNRKLSKSIMDAGFGMFKVMMDYKSMLYGNKLIYANTFYPSSKTCSNCGNIKKDLTINDRIYKCDICGFEADRDLNASYNLKKLATGYSDSINDNGV